MASRTTHAYDRTPTEEKVPMDERTYHDKPRLLNTIYFYLTGDCNLRCRHCWIAPDYRSHGQASAYLLPELFRSILKQARPMGLQTVKLTGGEPLLHPHIGEILRQVQLEDLRLVVETNGVLCTPEIARQIAACKNPHVSVSFDGADAKTHEWMRGVDGCFDDAVRGTENLVAAGLKPQIIMTLTRRNFHQAEAIVRLAEKLGAGSVKYNLLQPHARALQMIEAGEALPIEALIRLGHKVENELATATRLRLYFSYPMAFSPLGKMFGRDGTGCGICGIRGVIGVLADGSYAMCGIGETVPDLVFGHAAKDRLADVWAKTPAINEIREGLPKRLDGVCGNCTMKHICQGFCVAHNYDRHKNFWAPYWFCELAEKQGLFPRSRLLVKE